jgi:hypothetical protein
MEEKHPSSSDHNMSRLGVLWQWVNQRVRAVGTYNNGTDTLSVLIKDEELELMYKHLVVPAMQQPTMQGNNSHDALWLSGLFWNSMKKINHRLGNIKMVGKYVAYLGFSELEGMECVWPFLQQVTSEITANAMVVRIVRALDHQHNSMKSSPFDDSPKAQVWGTFIQRLHQETSKCMRVYPSSSASSSQERQERQKRSNIKHLVRLFHDFMVATKEVTLEYDEEVPEMLVGATVQVTWFKNTKYNGSIEEYMTVGEHKGAHKCVYTDGDVKYYHIKVVPNEKGTSYSIKGKWEVVGGGGRWWEVVGGGGRW